MGRRAWQFYTHLSARWTTSEVNTESIRRIRHLTVNQGLHVRRLIGSAFKDMVETSLNWALGPKLPGKAKQLLCEMRVYVSRNFNEVTRELR